MYMYVSLWDHNPYESRGIAIYHVDEEKGRLKYIKTVKTDYAFNQTFVDYSKKMIYVCNETDHVPDVQYPSGCIFGFEVDEETGDIFEKFHRVTGGPSPDYVSLTPDRKHMVVAHHSSANEAVTQLKKIDGKWQPVSVLSDSSVTLWTLKEDGVMDELVDVKIHAKPEVKWWLTGRAQNCHPHACGISPSGDLVCTPDKGDGHVYMYKINRETNELELCSRTLALHEDCQVRYPYYHPTKPWLYICEEAAYKDDLRIFAFEYTEDGQLTPLDVCSLLGGEPLDPPFISSVQGFCMDPKGEYLYASCRNPEMVCTLKIDQETGKLELLQQVPIQGGPKGARMPRGLGISPDGKFVAASCLNTHMVVLYRIGEDHLLTQVDYDTHVAGGSFVTFYDPKN